MVSQATIQARIWRGYAKAAQRIGVPYQFHRPDNGAFPGAALFTRPVSLNAEDMKYGRPSKHGKAGWYALADGTGLQPGDYLVGPQGVFFLAALQPLLPILAVECNRTVTLSRPPEPAGIGAQDYSGMTPDNAVPFASGVPCSILQGAKGEKNEVDLPADTRLPWWAILMPAAVGTLGYGDLIGDDLGRHYIVSSAELTELGYRITAMMLAA